MSQSAAAPNTLDSEMPASPNFAADAVALLALMGIKGVGFRTLASMMASNTPAHVLLQVEDKADALELLRRFGARVEGGDGVDWRAVRDQAHERASRQAAQFAAQGVTLLLRDDPRFPKRLMDLASPPHWLFVQGAIEPLHAPSIAAVGTREPTDDGRWLAGFVGAQLAEFGVPTVSGLALGVDQLVHQWSLRAGVPTVAVLGTGILSDYPKGAIELRERILEGGGSLVTEYLPRETYSAENFVKRNRIQAALGNLLIPIEWNARSGTAHTVRFATGLRRPIACLRMPDWGMERVALTKGCGLETGRLFTAPGMEAEFRDFVRAALGSPATQSAFDRRPAACIEGAEAERPRGEGPEVQPSLFGGS